LDLRVLKDQLVFKAQAARVVQLVQPEQQAFEDQLVFKEQQGLRVLKEQLVLQQMHLTSKVMSLLYHQADRLLVMSIF
jgi:hypothetical protein